MDIVILALNSQYIHSSLAPWYLKAEVPEAEVLEHTINEDMDIVLSEVIRRKPKLLAISVYIWNVTYAEKLITKVKDSLSEVVIAIGGPEVSYNAKEVLERCKAIDYVISGEGEKPFAALCNHVIYGMNCDLHGISHGDIIGAPYIGVGTPKSPYTDEYFASLNGRIAYFESSRGCPYSCAYCLSGRCEKVRFFDMDYVIANLVKLANSGTKTVKFVDRTFNADRARAFEILSFIIENSGKLFPCDVCFHFELSGDLLDDKTVSLLKTAPHGLFQFEIGIQSFNSETITAIHRKTDSYTLKHRITQLVSIGNAHVHTDLIAGLPYEDYNSFVNSFNEAYSLRADMLQLGFLKILHGTELEDRAEEYGFGYSKEPPYEVYETPWLSAGDFKKLKIVENAVGRLHNSGRFKRVLALCIPMFNHSYDFFYECGWVIEKEHALDEITDALFNFLIAKFPLKAEEIRDAMVCDRLATNSSRGLPKSLYKADLRINDIKKFLNADAETAQMPHIRRNIAILYNSSKAVYVDYFEKNNKGEYNLKYIEI